MLRKVKLIKNIIKNIGMFWGSAIALLLSSIIIALATIGIGIFYSIKWRRIVTMKDLIFSPTVIEDPPSAFSDSKDSYDSTNSPNNIKEDDEFHKKKLFEALTKDSFSECIDVMCESLGLSDREKENDKQDKFDKM